MRTEAETTLAEGAALYDELIATHQTLQKAHTDEARRVRIERARRETIEALSVNGNRKLHTSGN